MTAVMAEVRPVVYRHHGEGCTVNRHRTDRTAAQCLWPRAHWIAGDGVWASVSTCRGTTVMLHRTEDEARRSLEQVAAYGCGGRCRQRHRLVRLGDELVSGVSP